MSPTRWNHINRSEGGVLLIWRWKQSRANVSTVLQQSRLELVRFTLQRFCPTGGSVRASVPPGGQTVDVCGGSGPSRSSLSKVLQPCQQLSGDHPDHQGLFSSSEVASPEFPCCLFIRSMKVRGLFVRPPRCDGLEPLIPR